MAGEFDDSEYDLVVAAAAGSQTAWDALVEHFA